MNDDLTSGTAAVHCCKPIDNPAAGQLKPREHVPAEVYEDGVLEHPAIPGLMLEREVRLCSGHLDLVLKDGSERKETAEEKRFRILWKKPIPPTTTRTSHQFTKMDMSLFKQH